MEIAAVKDYILASLYQGKNPAFVDFGVEKETFAEAAEGLVDDDLIEDITFNPSCLQHDGLFVYVRFYVETLGGRVCQKPRRWKK
ncbi:hypothetical protein [Oceanobacillus kimchii]|uniref:hypothetical protein n=1 Tax=Oceanobacillus kimchii TaxID=746691 RepID=UPI0003485190|nr:hypothetical protein [Oceanobacillus kimchii]